MPYFVFKVTSFPFKQFELSGQFDGFKEASTHAKEMRKQVVGNASFKVMFGENQLQAEDILNQEREPQPMTGEDY